MNILDFGLLIGGIVALAASVGLLGAAFSPLRRAALEIWLLLLSSACMFAAGTYTLYILTMTAGVAR